MVADEFLPWSSAIRRALYGPGGFYRSRGGPAAHFRTSVHASALFAGAIAQLLKEVDSALGHPARIHLVDIGSGRGELLTAVLAEIAKDPLADRLRLTGVEIADRPAGLPESIVWSREPTGPVTGLLVANEWLDNVPFDIALATPDGWRIGLVNADGDERCGASPTTEQLAWLNRWWPRPPNLAVRDDEDGELTGLRAEIGNERDDAWRTAISQLDRGLAVAVDYAHLRAARPAFGTLTGFRDGRQCPPVPDGSCDITAHVALDSCAVAASDTADWTLLSDQRTVLRRLGVDGRRPPFELARTDPAGYLRALNRAGEAAELTDPAGLGGFGWLMHGVGCPVPVSLRDLGPARAHNGPATRASEG